MPRPTFVNCAFDPDSCPLLEGLSPEERRIRMAEDPVICNCISRHSKNNQRPETQLKLSQKPEAAPEAKPRRAAVSV